ncbi:hypothetical protein BHM03_00001919 [Ensete ventricosum]|nr:hypothetical protein BHM03_00001919 [Ensete ventricosum]
MTRSTAQLTTLLFLAALAVASAKPRSARRSLDEATAACEFVTVPQLCTSLAAKSGATTVPTLTMAAVNEAAVTAQEAKVTVERITAAPITDAKLKANLDVCWKSFSDSVDTLQNAKNDLQTSAPHNQLVTHISAAITYAGHCNDAFSQNPGLASPVADITSILKKLISNSLALAVSLHATMVEFGGEIVNTRPSGFHTATQMGSGHLAEEGFGRAAYIRSIRVVDPNDTLIPARNLSYYAEAPNCYDVQGGVDDSGESFFFFGGPGRNARCP